MLEVEVAVEGTSTGPGGNKEMPATDMVLVVLRGHRAREIEQGVSR